MKAYLIDPGTRTIDEKEFEGQPNSIYTLFNSLLVDTNDVLLDHTVYSATEAFEKGEQGFFLGEKLLFGKALVTGSIGFEDTDAAIDAQALEALTLFDLPAFYAEILRLLPPAFAFDTQYELTLDDISDTVTPEWVFYVFNMADERTKAYFLEHMEKTVREEGDLHSFLKKMGTLALKSSR